MSGPLRRTQRSRPADSGEPLPEGRTGEAEGAAPAAETPPAAPETARDEERPVNASTPAPDVPATTPDAPDTAPRETPPAAPDAPGADAAPADPATAETSADDRAALPTETPAGGDPAATGQGPSRSRWRPFRRGPKPTPAASAATARAAPPPVLLADADTPAGVDPIAAPMRPPAGRRGRLRRRLRYLRRARELMLRDLGGLLYEVHRSGGGSVDAHATVVGAKVQRIAGLDAEAHALEAALAAPRSETIVFEPGVGGTCSTCGELYGSDAHFCANCGALLGAGAPVAPAAVATPAVEPDRRAFWRRAARRAEPSPVPPAEAAPPGAASDHPTAIVEPPRAADEPTAVVKPDAPEQPRKPGDEPAAIADPGTGNPKGEAGEPANPLPAVRNGRAESRDAPGLTSGDPLMSEDSRK